jgi:pyruvate,orthophosphate dikinase
VQGYAEVVADLPTTPFDDLLVAELARTDSDNERELDHRSLKQLTTAMLDCYETLTGMAFPTDPWDQLASAAAAVYRSWDAPKAVSYRRLNGIGDEGGTAVTVQTMVFGNAGGASGAGVGFTRNPATGAKAFYYDFQFDGQGEDVVAGRQKLGDNDRLPIVLPAIWARLNGICREVETLFGDAQDFEFTVQSDTLFLLQTRRAKRTDWAALTIAVDMVEEGLLTPAEALKQISTIHLDAVARTHFVDPLPSPLTTALAACVGVASGAIALDSDAVKRLSAAGPTILVRRDTATTDIEGMALATGILTASGGRTSHAAVVARQLGKVCLVACPDLEIDLSRRQCRIGGTHFNEGDFISLDGNAGAVYANRLVPLTERPEKALVAIAGWRASAE